MLCSFVLHHKMKNISFPSHERLVDQNNKIGVTGGRWTDSIRLATDIAIKDDIIPS